MEIFPPVGKQKSLNLGLTNRGYADLQAVFGNDRTVSATLVVAQQSKGIPQKNMAASITKYVA